MLQKYLIYISFISLVALNACSKSKEVGGDGAFKDSSSLPPSASSPSSNDSGDSINDPVPVGDVIENDGDIPVSNPTTPSPVVTPPSPVVKPTPVTPVKIPVPQTMAALGDSITAALFGDLRRNDWDNFRQWSSIIDNLVSDRKVLSDLKTYEANEYSWATGYGDAGKSVKSHAYRLKKLNGNLKVLNAAISGDTADDVEEHQVDAVMKWSKSKNGRSFPDYVTMMIGPNDICAENVSEMTPTAKYQARIQNVVTRVVGSSPSTRMLILAVPDVERLRGIAKDSGAFVAPWSKCKNLWEEMKVCKTLTSESDPNKRKKIRTRIEEYNAALKQIVTNARGKYGDRIRFAENVYKARFDDDDLSIDCFHPNRDGQKLLSDSSWAYSWWK